MFIVKYCNKDLNFNGDEGNPNETVDLSPVRPAPFASSVDEYKPLDCVEVFRGSSWRKGLVRKSLTEKPYMVSVGTTKEESVFKHAELRPLMEWEDGVRRKGSIKVLCSRVGLEDLLASLLQQIGSGDYGDHIVRLCMGELVS